MFYTVWNSSSFENETPYVIPKSVQQHVTHYCNFPMRTSGVEGSLTFEELLNKKRFNLEMVQMVIRHGDRSPAMVVPNMDQRKYDYDCTFNTGDPNHKQLFGDFKEASEHFTQREFVKGAITSQSLVPSGKKCQLGQLSQIGFLQHLQLGKRMREAYPDLIDDKITSSNLLVRSTERSRCVQSAAAFLIGLLTKETIKSGKTVVKMFEPFNISLYLNN